MYFPANLKKKLKGLSFHCRKCVDQKYLWHSRTLKEVSKFIIKDGFFIRFLIIVISNLEKWKRQKLKNQPNQPFLQTEFIFCKSDFAHIIMHFHETKYQIFVEFKILAIKRSFPFNFPKIVVDGQKNFKLLPDISFDNGFPKIVLSSLVPVLFIKLI